LPPSATTRRLITAPDLLRGFTAAWQIDDHRLTSATTYSFVRPDALGSGFYGLDYFTILQGQHDHLLNEDLTVLTGSTQRLGQVDRA
jgi:hypothetical protein